MRLFLLAIAVIGYTLVPLAIDNALDRRRGFEGSRLERVYLLTLKPLARALDAASFVLARMRLFTAAQYTEEFLLGYHYLAKSIGTVCTRCAELAPGWWEFDVDCAMHDCGRCMECQHQSPDITCMTAHEVIVLSNRMRG